MMRLTKTCSYKQSVIIFFALFFISACGFQLRGNINLSQQLQPVFIQADSNDFLVQVLIRNMKQNHVSLTDNLSSAQTVLKLQPVRLSERAVAVRGKEIKENEINLSVSFQVLDRDNKTLSEQSLSLSRRYDFNSAQVLGTANEAEVIINEMKQELAAGILRRLSRL